MIDIDIRSKHYGETQVLGAIRCQIAPGESVAVLGPSGAGKTTLLRIVSGLDGEFEGRVSHPDKVSMVFQEPTLLPWRTAADNLTLVTGISPEEAEIALDRVGLAGKAGSYPDQLSLGQRRRLALARAFAARPDFLVMDEPFASLDGPLVSEMVSLTRGLLNGTSISTLIVTHSEDEAAALADRIVRLDGNPATLTLT